MPSQDLRFRRKIVTTGEPQPKNRLAIVLSAVAAAIIVPALAYTAMHPANVGNTVRQITKHFPSQIKNIRIAVRAARETPTPLPSPTATATSGVPTPAAKSSAKPSDAERARLAHLRRAHQIALAHGKKLSSTASSAADLNHSNDPNASSVNATAAPVAAAPAPTHTPAQVAAAGPPQVPISEATPVYAPEIVVDARFTRQVHPDYPDVAKAQNAQGTAIVLATIGPNGNVLSARIDQSTGNRLLDAAALEAARASGFEPPKINGKPATETYRLIYTFAI